VAKKKTKKKEATPKSTTKKSSPEPKNEQDGFSPAQFLQGTREEFSKVVWPSQQQLISESAAVMLMVILVATTIYFVDNLFSWIAGMVF